MTTAFAVYNTTTGDILQNIFAQTDGQQYFVETGEAIINGNFPMALFFVADPGGTPTITAKDISVFTTPDTMTADGVDVFTLSTLANPTTIQINLENETYSSDIFTVTDGTFNYTTTIAGDYLVVVEEFHHEIFEIILTAS